MIKGWSSMRANLKLQPVNGSINLGGNMPYFKLGEEAVVVNSGFPKRDGNICKIIGGLIERQGFKPNGLKSISETYLVEFSDKSQFQAHPSHLRKLPSNNDKISWKDMKDLWQPNFIKRKEKVS